MQKLPGRVGNMRRVIALLVALCGQGASCIASESWPGIRAEAFQDRPLRDVTGVVSITAPYRAEDVRNVPLEANVQMPQGHAIKSITFIVDENPSPVAAVFKMAGERTKARIVTNIRLNVQSDVHVVVEATDGTLYMAERLVKFAGGQAACSAPPVGDPHEVAANMGKMEFTSVGDKALASHARAQARFTVNHPNHTGMVMDPTTLYFVPLLVVQSIEARQGDELIFEMTGSITLAQNPVVEFDYLTNGAADINMRVTDTSGAQWSRRFPIGPAS